MAIHRPADDRGLVGLIAATLVTTAILFLALPVLAQTPPAVPPAPEVPTTAVRTVVTDHGLVGEFYAPATPGKHPAILVLGGSEGGLMGSVPMARRLANEGYATFALAYFAAPGLPNQLDSLPLEYFRTALDWMEARPAVDGKRVGIIGGSKGAEAALIIASRNPDIRVVAVGMPSSVAWQSINYSTVSGSWTQGGQPIPYLAYDNSQPFTSVLDLYQRSLATLPSHPETAIAVERINGPVMLVSGGSDNLWPSSEMSREIVARLADHHFKYPVQPLDFPAAGHAVFGAPPPADSPRIKMLGSLGGTPEANLAARADGWPRVLAFLKAALKP